MARNDLMKVGCNCTQSMFEPQQVAAPTDKKPIISLLIRYKKKDITGMFMKGRHQTTRLQVP